MNTTKGQNTMTEQTQTDPQYMDNPEIVTALQEMGTVWASKLMNAAADRLRAADERLATMAKERDKARCQLDVIRNNTGLMDGTPVEEVIQCVGELATFRENARNRDCERERLARVQKERDAARA